MESPRYKFSAARFAAWSFIKRPHRLKVLWLSFLCLILCATSVVAQSDTVVRVEDRFGVDPLVGGWRVHGDSSLFKWTAGGAGIDTTWDSSRENSYFYRPLGTILSRSDDFSLEFEIELQSIEVGSTQGKPFTFQIAIGFLNLVQAAAPGFRRGTAVDSPNVVEFDYFPDSGFGATVSPTLISSNRIFSTGFNFPLEIEPAHRYAVRMEYSGGLNQLTTSMTRDGEAFGPVKPVKLGAAFTDFRLNAVGIFSYSHAGADGSVRAVGRVRRMAWQVPSPPVEGLRIEAISQGMRIHFAGHSGWEYLLERQVGENAWMPVGKSLKGVPGGLLVDDMETPSAAAWYRVRADLP